MNAMMQTIGRVLRGRRAAQRLARDVRGVAAIEFALIASFLAVAVLNVSDVAVYLFDELEVNNATEMAAQAAWAACDLNHIPAATKCPGMTSAVNAAVASTSLGDHVSVQSSTEGYYCATTGGTLQYMSDTSSRPADCSAAGVATESAGDYVKIQTSYSYSSIFPGLSVASTFPSTITSTSWMRLG